MPVKIIIFVVPKAAMIRALKKALQEKIQSLELE